MRPPNAQRVTAPKWQIHTASECSESQLYCGFLVGKKLAPGTLLPRTIYTTGVEAPVALARCGMSKGARLISHVLPDHIALYSWSSRTQPLLGCISTSRSPRCWEIQGITSVNRSIGK